MKRGRKKEGREGTRSEVEGGLQAGRRTADIRLKRDDLGTNNWNRVSLTDLGYGRLHTPIVKLRFELCIGYDAIERV